jgi:hypothetical protein
MSRYTGTDSDYRSFNVKTSKSPHAILNINEENGHLAVREMRKIPGDY